MPTYFAFGAASLTSAKNAQQFARTPSLPGDVNRHGLKDVTWHGTKLNCPGWDDGQARALGFTLAGFDDDPDIHVMMNMHWAALDMDIPTISGRQWARVVDTSLPSPSDIAEPGMEAACPGQSYRVNGRSIVVLLNKPA
jgi:isoamylase